MRHGLSELGLGLGNFHSGRAIGNGSFGFLLGLQRRSLVEIGGTLCGVGKHRHDIRLDLQQTAADEIKLLAALRQNNADLARLQPGQQGRVARGDADLAFLGRYNDHCRIA